MMVKLFFLKKNLKIFMLFVANLRWMSCRVLLLLNGLVMSMLLGSQGYGSAEEVTTTVSEDSLIKNLRSQTPLEGMTTPILSENDDNVTPPSPPSPPPRIPPRPRRVVTSTPPQSPPVTPPAPPPTSPSYVTITESFEATRSHVVEQKRAVEMLWALDNSESMKKDIESIKKNLSDFTAKIKENDVDLSMTVITATKGDYSIPMETFNDAGVRVVNKRMHSFDQLSMISAYLNPESWTLRYDQISIGSNDNEKCYLEGYGVLSPDDCFNANLDNLDNTYVLLPIAYIPPKMNTYSHTHLGIHGDGNKGYARYSFKAGEKKFQNYLGRDNDAVREEDKVVRQDLKIYDRGNYESFGSYDKDQRYGYRDQYNNEFFSPLNGKLKIIVVVTDEGEEVLNKPYRPNVIREINKYRLSGSREWRYAQYPLIKPPGSRHCISKYKRRFVTPEKSNAAQVEHAFLRSLPPPPGFPNDEFKKTTYFEDHEEYFKDYRFYGFINPYYNVSRYDNCKRPLNTIYHRLKVKLGGQIFNIRDSSATWKNFFATMSNQITQESVVSAIYQFTLPDQPQQIVSVQINDNPSLNPEEYTLSGKNLQLDMKLSMPVGATVNVVYTKQNDQTE